MKTPNIKNFIAIAWPFLGLAFFLVWAWLYVKPLLPEDFITFEKIKNIFTKEEILVHPDEKYNFIYAHDALKPKPMDELIEAVNNIVIVPTITVTNTNELQTAIANAKPGDKIELQAGIYKTKLFIDKDLTIIGQGTSTVIMGGDEGTAVYVENCQFNLYNLMITSSNSAIKINNSSGEIRATFIKENKKSGLELRNSNFIIKENIIIKNGSYGVFADPTSEVVVEGNFIDDNKGFEVRIEGEKKIYR